MESRQRQPSETGGIDKKPAPIFSPGGGLDAHEALGGHLLKRHVGKTEKELLDRFIKEPKIIGSSSFFNRAVAEEAVAATIKAKQAEIDAWLVSGKIRSPELTATMEMPVGITILNSYKVTRLAYSVKLLLKRDSTKPLGYYILTGYPE